MVAFDTLLRGAVGYLVGTAINSDNRALNNIPTWIDSAGATANDFNLQDTGDYILGAVGKGLEIAGNKAGPVFNGAVNGIQTFDSEAAMAGIVDMTVGNFQTLSTTLAPAWLLRGSDLTSFRRMHGLALGGSVTTIIPGLYVAGTHLADISSTQLKAAVGALADAGSEKILPVFDEAGNWLYDHRVRIAVIAGVGVVILYPGLVTTPILWASGFASGGVKAGSFVAFIHSCIGSVKAGSFFAMLQSAATGGGYGQAVVHGVVRVGAVAAGIIHNFFDARKVMRLLHQSSECIKREDLGKIVVSLLHAL